MKSLWKTLLLWLLIAALPIQGLAAVIQSSCGRAHHASMVSSLSATLHHHDDGVAHHHDGDDTTIQASADDAAAHVQASIDDASISKHEASFCSACAACCVGAVAPPSVPLWIPSYSHSESVVVSPTPLVSGYIPASLERPPKRISA